MGADNGTDALRKRRFHPVLRTDPPTDRPFNGKNDFRSDIRFLIMNYRNETNLKIICSISIRIIVFPNPWVSLGLHNGGLALLLE